MGGEDSGISDETTDVLLEGAFFHPSVVARGRRYGLITDASQRFERGVDPELQERAIERATQLLLECAGGTPGPLEVTRTAERYPARSAIRVRHQRVQHVLGAPLSADVVADCLTRLGMKVEGSAARLVGYSAELALRYQHRRRPDRGSRAPVRLRQYSRAERDRRAAHAAVDRNARAQRARCRSARRPRLSGSDHVLVHRAGDSGTAASQARHSRSRIRFLPSWR